MPINCFKTFLFSVSLPTDDQKEIIHSLALSITTIYNNDQHEDMLRSLYSVTERHGSYQRISRAWKSLGFQSEDPVRDIRGM